MKKLSLFLTVIGLFFTSQVFAQISMGQPSPGASVTQMVGMTEVKIEYSSPGVKGRTVWGELVPYGQAWRAGANAATKITFSTPVMIGGKTVEAGSYTVFVLPVKEGDWSFHFNSKGNSVFAYDGDNGQDLKKLQADNAASVSAKPVMLNDSKERLAYYIEAGADNSGKGTVTLHWDKVKVSFEVSTAIDELKTKAVADAIASADRSWRTYMDAANYYAESDANKAMEMIDKSIGVRPNYFWNMWTKSQMLAKDGKYDKALTMLMEAKKLGEANPDGAFNFFKTQMEEDMKNWLPNASKKWKKMNKM